MALPGDDFVSDISWRLFTDPISFNMERAMLQAIKKKAEASAPSDLT